MMSRRAKRKNQNPRVSRSTLQYPVGEEDIDLVPTKSSSLRYLEIEEQDFGANLSSNGKESPHSPFGDKTNDVI